MARDLEWFRVDTNWHTTTAVTRMFIMKTTGLWPWLSLDIIGSNISGTSGRFHTFPSSFKHYTARGFWTGQLYLETTISDFPLRLGIPRETRVHLPCPREMLTLRPPVQVASASNPNMYPLVVKPGDRKSCFYSWLSYWNIEFSWPGYAIGGCTCQKFKVRSSE